MEISENLAAQIVAAVHDVVKKDINFIDQNGKIIGSTDRRRIGQFHAAGAYAVRTQSPVIVDDAHPFEGARTGINYPIFLDGAAIAVIGMTGDPGELQPYGFLITKISEVFLKEQKLNEELLSSDRALQYLISSLIQGTIREDDQFAGLLRTYQIDTAEDYCVLSIKLQDSSLEPSLRFYFRQAGFRLSYYRYPNEWILILSRSEFSRFSTAGFARKYSGKLFAGQGDFCSCYQLARSCSHARIARKHAERLQETYCSIEDISIEIILESLPADIQNSYAEKLLGCLNEKELSILKTYFSLNQSLKDASEFLHIHKNTLQYQLDLVTEKSGLNPRRFQDAFLMQFALLCRRY